MTSSLGEAGVLAVPLIKSKYQQNQRGTGKEVSGGEVTFTAGYRWGLRGCGLFHPHAAFC